MNIPFLALRPFSTLPPFLAAALGMLGELMQDLLVDEFSRNMMSNRINESVLGKNTLVVGGCGGRGGRGGGRCVESLAPAVW